LRRWWVVLTLLIAVVIPGHFALAQTATPAPTPTPDYRTFVEVGALDLFAGSTPPTGWLTCDGSAVSRTTYARLFAVIGTTFGVGDGSTTFNLPDLRGRVPVGSGAGTGLSPRTTGQTFGEETHTLTITEMPSHTHRGKWVVAGTAGGAAGTWSNGGAYTNANSQIENTGGGTAFTQMQPSLVVNFIIWAGTVEMSSQNLVVTVVLVFPTHTSTPTPTPTLTPSPTFTPTSGPSPTPTLTASPTGLSVYEVAMEVAGQDVLMRYEVRPSDITQIVFWSVILVLLAGLFVLYVRRKR
jgi:microcystin-dependent protein